MGATGASGRLPVTAGVFSEGTGVDTSPLGRLGHALPETVQMSRDKLNEIDEVVNGTITILN